MTQANEHTRLAMAQLPRCTFLMTAAYENKRSGQLVESVQHCGDSPLLVCVAARKGHSVEPLIRDSRTFALCRVHPDDRLLLRKFAEDKPPDELGDPFDSIEVERIVTGAPVIRRAVCALDCEVVRHFDLEAEYELYVGQVLGARVFSDGL